MADVRGSIALLSRLLLGAVFVYASLHKIADPPAFAKIVWGYNLLPGALVNPFALYLPWLELLVGLALLAGVWLRAAALVTGGLLLVFLVAIAINLGRGLDFDCGCFSHTPGAAQGWVEGVPVLGHLVRFLFTSPEPWTTLWRDVALLAMAAAVWRRPLGWRRRRGGRVAAGSTERAPA
jgi:uncharacterized membrane protein YphA (DoxX/SURF4 family)